MLLPVCIKIMQKSLFDCIFFAISQAQIKSPGLPKSGMRMGTAEGIPCISLNFAHHNGITQRMVQHPTGSGCHKGHTVALKTAEIACATCEAKILADGF